MSWKEILRKAIELDDTSCCEDARLALIMYFEKYAELAVKDSDAWDEGKGLRNSLLQTASDLSEESCEELKESIIRFQEIWDLDRSELFDADKLRDIMNTWEKCEDELKEVKVGLEVKQ